LLPFPGPAERRQAATRTQTIDRLFIAVQPACVIRTAPGNALVARSRDPHRWPTAPNRNKQTAYERKKNTVRASAIVCAHQLYLVINPQLHRRDHFTPSPPRHVTPINIAGFCHAPPVISDGLRGRIHCLLARWRRLRTGIRNVRLFDPTNLGGGRGAF